MNPSTPSFGTGGNLLGAPASNVLGMPPGIQQQSPSSASFQPGLMPPPPGQAPQGPPQQFPQPQGQSPQMPQAPQQPQMPQPMAPQQGTVGMPPAVPESLHIIKALTARLATLSKAEEMQRTGTV